eukprot:5556250-Prymnesium_polylepis.2
MARIGSPSRRQNFTTGPPANCERPPVWPPASRKPPSQPLMQRPPVFASRRQELAAHPNGPIWMSRRFHPVASGGAQLLVHQTAEPMACDVARYHHPTWPDPSPPHPTGRMGADGAPSR